MRNKDELSLGIFYISMTYNNILYSAKVTHKFSRGGHFIAFFRIILYRSIHFFIYRRSILYLPFGTKDEWAALLCDAETT